MSKPRFKKKPGQTIPTTRISVVVVSDDNQVLLVRHKKGNKHHWVLPGGRLEYGETFHECGIREVKEETGLDVQIEQFLYLAEAIAPDRSRHIINIYLKAKVIGGTLRVGNEPVLAGVSFVSLAELERMTLFPPIGKKIIEAVPARYGSPIEYLGNLWV